MIGLGLSAGSIRGRDHDLHFKSAMIPIMNSHSQTIWQTADAARIARPCICGAAAHRAVHFAARRGDWPDWSADNSIQALVIAVLGTILLVFSMVQLFNPYLLRVEDKAWLDAMAAEHEAKRAKAMAHAGDTVNDMTLVVGDALPEDILHEDITSVI